MIEFIKARLGERSTVAGIVAVLFGVTLVTVAWLAPVERYDNIKNALEYLQAALIGGGVAAMLFPEKKP